MTVEQRDKLLNILKKYKKAIVWKISDFKGISPAFCTHKILMEDNYKLTVITQLGLNLNMKEIVQNEVIRILDAAIIYLISDSEWMSLV